MKVLCLLLLIAVAAQAENCQVNFSGSMILGIVGSNGFQKYFVVALLKAINLWKHAVQAIFEAMISVESRFRQCLK